MNGMMKAERLDAISSDKAYSTSGLRSPNPLEQPRLDAEAANFRLKIITSFLLGATMTSLSPRCVHHQTECSDGADGNDRMVVGRIDCADALLDAYHALHVLCDSGYDVP